MNSACSTQIPLKRKGPFAVPLALLMMHPAFSKGREEEPQAGIVPRRHSHTPRRSRKLLGSLPWTAIRRMTWDTALCCQAVPWLASPPPRGLGTPATSFSSPLKDAPLSLGELLTWFSEVSEFWMAGRGRPEAAALALRLPTKCCWMGQ